MEKFIFQCHLTHVNIIGRVLQDEMSKYLAVADIYVMASKNVASPKALNDAMNFSLSIVVSDGVETIEQLLKEGVNGYKFKVGDIEGIASVIEKIIRNPHRNIMGQESKRIVGEYSFERVIDNWILTMRYAMGDNKWKQK